MKRKHALLAGIAATAAVAWLVGSIGVRAARVAPNPRGEPGPPAQPLTLEARDGSQIAATFWPGASEDAPAILIVPGIGSLHRRLAPNAAWFAAHGYAVLAIDLRGHGHSSPALHSFGWTESADVHAAFAWLKACQRRAKIAVIGISMGGAAALVGPAGPVPADAFSCRRSSPISAERCGAASRCFSAGRRRGYWSRCCRFNPNHGSASGRAVSARSRLCGRSPAPSW